MANYICCSINIYFKFKLYAKYELKMFKYLRKHLIFSIYIKYEI